MNSIFQNFKTLRAFRKVYDKYIDSRKFFGRPAKWCVPVFHEVESLEKLKNIEKLKFSDKSLSSERSNVDVDSSNSD